MKPESKGNVHRTEWPRIREATIKGSTIYQVDPRPHGKREYFSVLTHAKTRADQISRERDEHGVHAVHMPVRERVELEDVKKLLRPYGRTVKEAVEHFIAYLKQEAKIAHAATMPDGLKEWLGTYEQKYRNRKCSPRTLAEISSFAGRISQSFADMRVPEVDDNIVREFLESYRIAGDKVPSEQTLKNIRTKLSQFFEFARIRKWITANPCDLVVQDGVERETHILSVDEAETLLMAAQASPHCGVAVPFVAVSLFAGLRPGEAEQLRWEDIHFDVDELDVLGETSKTGRLRHVRMEATLLAWLEPYKQGRGRLVGSAWRAKWEEVRRSVGYRIGEPPEGGWSKESKPWLPDVLRHTYASYWLPIKKSKSELALQMGNSERIVDKHYRRTIRESVAEKFWAIRPT
jgi:integrase